MGKSIIFTIILIFAIYTPFIIMFIASSDNASIELNIFHPNVKLDIMNPLNRDYRIEEVQINIDNTDSRLTRVRESNSYILKGCYKELFAELEGVHAAGVRLISKNAYCEPECEISFQKNELIAKYGQICDQNPTLFLSLLYENVTVRKMDAYELHYTLWGDNGRLARSLNGVIELPYDINELDVYFRAYGQHANYRFEDNKVYYDAKNIKGPFEIVIAYGRGDNLGISGRELIREREETYQNKISSSMRDSYAIIILILLIILIAPLFVFLKFGREPKTKKLSFSREVPKELKPYQVNLLSEGPSGELTPDAISSTILDLARRGHIELEEVRDSKGKIKKDIYVTFNNNEQDKLSGPEKKIFDFFSNIAQKTKENSADYDESSKKVGAIVASIIIGFFFIHIAFSFAVWIPMIFFSAVNSLFFSVVLGLAIFGGFVYLAVRIIKKIWASLEDNKRDYQTMMKSQYKWSEIAMRMRSDTTLNMKFRMLEKELKNEIRNEMGFPSYFDSKGHSIASVLFLLGIVLSIWSAVRLSKVIDFRPAQFDLIIPIIVVLAIISFILLLLPNRVFGRYSDKGIETHTRIMAFKKFITDYSSLKRYPPSSLTIWDEIIVYATALGCAENVEKHMTKIVGKTSSTGISRAASIGMASSISSSVRSSSSSSGGRGGGRAGGGGRGAR